MFKKHIVNSVWSVQLPTTGQNMQQVLSKKVYLQNICPDDVDLAFLVLGQGNDSLLELDLIITPLISESNQITVWWGPGKTSLV